MELTGVRKRAVLAACCSALFVVSMDATAVNVALPSIRSDLGASASQLQWVIDAYTLVLASFLMLSGAVADRFGRRRIFRIGLVVFAIGSGLCSLAPTSLALVGARVIQALGGSMLNPVAMSIIAATFTDRAERARAVGIWGATFGLSMACGPIVGGALVDSIGWRSVFWINLPICLIAVIATTLIVPADGAMRARSFDPAGQALVTLAMAAGAFALIEAAYVGWSATRVIVALVVATCAATAFVVVERRVRAPFLDPRFFGSIPFRNAAVIAVGAFAVYGAFLFVTSLYLQQVRGMSAAQTGLAYLPIALATLVCAPLSGRLTGRYGVRPSLAAAGALMASGTFVMTSVCADSPLWLIAVAFLLFGGGFSAVGAPITTAAVNGMPAAQAGVASGVASASRQVGVSVGVALSGSFIGTSIASLGTDRAGVDEFLRGAHVLWWLGVAVGLVVIALGVHSSTERAERSAHKVAARFDTAPRTTDRRRDSPAGEIARPEPRQTATAVAAPVTMKMEEEEH